MERTQSFLDAGIINKLPLIKWEIYENCQFISLIESLSSKKCEDNNELVINKQNQSSTLFANDRSIGSLETGSTTLYICHKCNKMYKVSK